VKTTAVLMWEANAPPMWGLLVVVAVLILLALYLRRSKILRGEASRNPSSPSTAESRISQEATSLGAGAWIRPGNSVTVAGHAIQDGMVYIGSQVADETPGLICPQLAVDTSHAPLAEEKIGYWPNYARLSPRHRGSFLRWLATGRAGVSVDIGYVFMFFYGLERRVLAGLTGPDYDPREALLIQQEIRRLLIVYGSSSSFNRYAAGLAQYLACLRAERDGSAVPRISPLARTWEVPYDVRMALGQHCAAGIPIPAECSLAWVLGAPEITFRTPARRCEREFQQLFLIRYRERFGDGLKIEPSEKRLIVRYRPASSAFHGREALLQLDLPDVTGAGTARGTLTLLRDLAESCTEALDKYSRAMGRKPSARTGPSPAALLPAELLSRDDGSCIAALFAWLAVAVPGDAPALMPVSTLLEHVRPVQAVSPLRKELEMTSLLLEKLGYGLEPDVRTGTGTPTGGRLVAVFHLPEGETAQPSEEYAGVAALVTLAALVAAADASASSEEENLISRQLVRVTEAERRRLSAHVSVIQADPRVASVPRDRIAALSSAQAAAIGDFLLTVAVVDGRLTGEEITMLQRCYRMLGLDPALVHSGVHSLLAKPHDTAAETGKPVVVKEASRTAPTYEIPEPEAEDAADVVVLSLSKIEQKRKESAIVETLLAEVFHGKEEEPSPEETDRPAGQHDSVFELLDEAHGALVRVILTLQVISRTEWNSLCAQHGLLPEGAMEVVNEAFAAFVGDVLVSGTEPIVVDRSVAEEVGMAHGIEA